MSAVLQVCYVTHDAKLLVTTLFNSELVASGATLHPENCLPKAERRIHCMKHSMHVACQQEQVPMYMHDDVRQL